MEVVNFWDKYRVHGKKIVIVALTCLCFEKGLAQNQRQPFFDFKKKYHFGFYLGTTIGNFKPSYSQLFYQQDSFSKIEIERFPGVVIGAVADLHLGNYFDLRFTPSVGISQRNVNYFRGNVNVLTKTVESSLFDLPLLVKLKSERHQNIRIYMVAGVKYSYDLSSDRGAVEDPTDPKLILGPNNWFYEYGVGFDIYTKYFKLSPELKFSTGVNNVLDHDERLYNAVFEKLRSNFVSFSFYIEG